MSYRPRHAEPSVLVKVATRGRVIASAAALAAAGAGALSVVPASAAATALPVSFDAVGSATVHYNSAGDIVLDPGAYGDSGVSVDLTSLGDTSVPQTPPSFTVDNYTNNAPRWMIVLSNDTSIYGYPAQAGSTANDSFTGAQWTTGSASAGSALETYQQALAQVCPTLSACQVTRAYIDDDSSFAPATPPAATLSNVQYDGETAAAGTAVTVAPIPEQDVTDTAKTQDVQVQASTTTAPDTLTYAANGTLPNGLTINSATGLITGTPESVPSGYVHTTITVTDADGDSASVPILYAVNPAPGAICSTDTGCSWQRLADPSSMVMDVKGQAPHTGTPIIAYAVKTGDPAADFTKIASGSGSSYQLAYTPYGTTYGASKHNATLGTEAYNPDGSAKYCVSSVADKSGQGFQLRPCAKSANEWQDFLAGGSVDGESMIEPTYGTPGVTAGTRPMAMNDAGFGGDGTPLINYAATNTGNERFTPGL